MKPKGHDYSTLLIWAALAVTVSRYVGAFVASDVGQITGGWSAALTVLMAVSGIGMGFLDVLGLAYVFDGWRRALPAAGVRWSNRFKVLTGFVVALFVVGLAILTPFTVSRVMGEGMGAVLGLGTWWWSLAVNLAPILLIGGVMFAQTGVVIVRGDATTQPVAQLVAKSAEKSNRDRILALHHEQPKATHAQLAETVGVSRQYVDRVVKRNGRTN